MKNNFAGEYETYKAIEAEYDAADLAGDEAKKSLVRACFASLRVALTEKGAEYFHTFELYREARDCGNEYIDLHDAIWDNQVAGLIENLRNMGIDHFTFSSTWSSAVETAWLFTENGCELEGLVRIKSHYKKFRSEEYETAPAYLFRIN